MLPYFPFEQDQFVMKLGVRALRPDETLIEVDEPHYVPELELKQALLAASEPLRFAGPPGTEPAQWETVTTLLPLMARQHPRHFALEVEGGSWHWTNRLLGTQTRFTPGDTGSLPLAPLDWVGRQVQEDLLLMDGSREGLPLMAGQLCFPAGWCLGDKLGQPVLLVHGPVPHFARTIGDSTVKLMQGLKAGRPVTRVNWSLSVTDQMDLAPWTRPQWRPLVGLVTAENAGERCFLRLERQTLSLLPETGAILFTIHTYRAPVASEVVDPARRRRFAAVLRSAPEDTRDYKGISPFLEPLLAWLDAGGTE